MSVFFCRWKRERREAEGEKDMWEEEKTEEGLGQRRRLCFYYLSSVSILPYI